MKVLNVVLFNSPKGKIGINKMKRAFTLLELLVVIRDIKGQEFYSKVVIDIEDGVLVAIPIDKSIPPGIYLVIATSENTMYSQKLIVK